MSYLVVFLNYDLNMPYLICKMKQKTEEIKIFSVEIVIKYTLIVAISPSFEL